MILNVYPKGKKKKKVLLDLLPQGTESQELMLICATKWLLHTSWWDVYNLLCTENTLLPSPFPPHPKSNQRFPYSLSPTLPLSPPNYRVWMIQWLWISYLNGTIERLLNQCEKLWPVTDQRWNLYSVWGRILMDVRQVKHKLFRTCGSFPFYTFFKCFCICTQNYIVGWLTIIGFWVIIVRPTFYILDVQGFPWFLF